MEKRPYDHIQWSLVVEDDPSDIDSSSYNSNNIPHETLNLNLNLLDHQLPPSPSPSRENHLIWQNHLSQYPISSSPNHTSTIYQTLIPQNPLLQDRFYQNPISQNHLLVQENHHQHRQPFNYHLMNNLGHRDMSLEAALSRMNISTTAPNHHTHQFLDHNHLINKEFSSPYSQQHSLNRMRSISASLGLHRANSNSAVDRYYLNGGNNLAALNQSFPSYSNNNRQNLRRRTSSYDGLSYGLNLSRHNPNRLDSSSHRSINRARSINGLDSANSNRLYSPLQIVEARNYGNYSSLEQVRGRVAMVATDQEGCRFLQKKVDELIPEQTEMIFLELKDHLCDLIIDQFANYLIQKLFLACNEVQISQVLLTLTQNGERLKNICVHPHGTRAMQKMIEGIRNYPKQKSTLVNALKNITVYLAKNQNGQHVIQQCLKFFEFDYTQYLLDEIAQNCLEIAMDRSGCCVLQKAVDKAIGELKDRIITNITNHAFVLSIDPFGNYVVQYILQMHIPYAEAYILEQLKGNHVNLSMDKYGSNVVEKCLKECNENNVAEIIQELMHSPFFLEVLQHPFGNYVVQSAIDAAKVDIYDELAHQIQMFQGQLQSHLHGKKVLAKIRAGKRNNHEKGAFM